MKKDKKEVWVNLRMTAEEKEKISSFADEKYDGNLSLAIRQMIRDWLRNRWEAVENELHR
jgi:hypothetical protein